MFTHLVKLCGEQHFGQIKESKITNTHPPPPQKRPFPSQKFAPAIRITDT
jgi:hypothetical protein